eukprot:scaffold148721_cov28-Tisochrysis_lutea.AAC.8
MMRASVLATAIGSSLAFSTAPIEEMFFNRVSTYPVCLQIDANCNVDTSTVAEIVTASADGMTLAYSDSSLEQVGFVDISNLEAPVGMGVLPVGGEPTSVAAVGNYVLAGVNTSPDYVNPSGSLKVIDMTTRSIVREIDLGGQPDSVAVSPDHKWAAVAIENERDEDLGDGFPPQMPAGFLVVIHLEGAVADWTVKTVDLTGLPVDYPTDPEPEFVSINSKNKAIVTLQENNGLVLVDLPTGGVEWAKTAGKVDLTLIDTDEEDIIDQSSSLSQVPREPDGVTWMGDDYFATSDEGDLVGGSRGFTIYDASGNILWTSGSFLDHLAVSIGHYPENRSGNKGSEPENCAYAEFNGEKLLFINMERSNAAAVFNVDNPHSPVYKQVLPTQVGPEGGIALPTRGAYVVASEVDDRASGIRSSLNIFALSSSTPAYPTLVSNLRVGKSVPIPWSAMSGLAPGPGALLYSVEDSFYKKTRFFTIDTSTFPARLTKETRIVDTHGVFAAFPPQGEFDASDLAAMINEDKTVNIDGEGVALFTMPASMGGETVMVVASEGRGTVGDANRPVESLNFLFFVAMDGTIRKVATLPESVNAKQLRFGFEGVAVWGEKLVVAFQRVWAGDENVRIGIYDVASDAWDFVFYPLDAPASQFGGWVGLSDVSPIGGGRFAVVERDNNGGFDAVIKEVYTFDLTGYTSGMLVSKTQHTDLIPLLKSTGGMVVEKVEGLAVKGSTAWIINDNDGVDDNSGETNLLSFAF